MRPCRRHFRWIVPTTPCPRVWLATPLMSLSFGSFHPKTVPDEPAPLDCQDEEATKTAFYVDKTLNIIDISKALGVAQLNAEICLNPVSLLRVRTRRRRTVFFQLDTTVLAVAGTAVTEIERKGLYLFLSDTPTAFHFVHYRGQGTCYFCLPTMPIGDCKQRPMKNHHHQAVVDTRERAPITTTTRTTTTTRPTGVGSSNHNKEGLSSSDEDDESSEEDTSAHSMVPNPKPSRRPTDRPTPAPTCHGTAAPAPTWWERYQQWYANTYHSSSNNGNSSPTRNPTPHPTRRHPPVNPRLDLPGDPRPILRLDLPGDPPPLPIPCCCRTKLRVCTGSNRRGVVCWNLFGENSHSGMDPDLQSQERTRTTVWRRPRLVSGRPTRCRH